MFKTYSLLPLDPINWQTVFDKYLKDVAKNGSEEFKSNTYKRYRFVEDELEHMDHIREVLVANTILTRDIQKLSILERYYVQYLAWFKTVEKTFKNYTMKHFTYYWTDFTNTDVETEKLRLYYNLACVLYAKGNTTKYEHFLLD